LTAFPVRRDVVAVREGRAAGVVRAAVEVRALRAWGVRAVDSIGALPWESREHVLTRCAAAGDGRPTFVSEPLTDEQYARVQEALGGPVWDVLTHAALGLVAARCDHGGLHVQAESVVHEVLDVSGHPAERGHLVVAPLRAGVAPQVRVDTGVQVTPGPACACGRGLPRVCVVV